MGEPNATACIALLNAQMMIANWARQQQQKCAHNIVIYIAISVTMAYMALRHGQ